MTVSDFFLISSSFRKMVLLFLRRVYSSYDRVPHVLLSGERAQEAVLYLREAGKELYGNEAIQPTWGIVTDMNEFRLYWRNRMPAQYQRFIITTTTTDDTVSLLAKTAEPFQPEIWYVECRP